MIASIALAFFAIIAALPPQEAGPADAPPSLAWEHRWIPLEDLGRKVSSSEALRGNFRVQTLDDEVIVLATRLEGNERSREPIAAEELELSILRLDRETGELQEFAPLPRISLPSGPLPAFAAIDSSRFLLATARHLVWSDGRETRIEEAPWRAASTAPDVWNAGGWTWVLSPEGELFVVTEPETLHPIFARGAPPVEHAVYVEPGRLWWVDARNVLHSALVERGIGEGLLPQARELFACPLPPVKVQALGADSTTATLIGMQGRVIQVRDGFLRFDSADHAWPLLEPIALCVRDDGTIEIADRCGWITTLELRGREGFWDAYRLRLRLGDAFAEGWNNTHRACPLPGRGWILRGEATCLIVRPSGLTEIHSGTLPYGLTESGVEGLDQLQNFFQALLPRTIRGVDPGNLGLWVFTSTSIDLLDRSSQRILHRELPGVISQGVSTDPLQGLEGGLVYETEDEEGRIRLDTVILRAPADRRIVRVTFERDPSGPSQVTTEMRPGIAAPPPPYGGMAANAKGDVALATRRGLALLRHRASRFETIGEPSEHVPLDVQDLVHLEGEEFALVGNGRAYRWRPGEALRPLSQGEGLLALWREGEGKVAATDGHRIFSLTEDGASPWPCGATPPENEIRAFGRVSEGGDIVILDRENRLYRWEIDRWLQQRIREPVSRYSTMTRAPGAGLYLNLDASLWYLEPGGKVENVLDYRVALAGWIDQWGIQNVLFFFVGLLLTLVLLSTAGAILLPKSPIPSPPGSTRPWNLVHVLYLILVFSGGQQILAMGVFSSPLGSYPVIGMAIVFTLPALAAVWLVRKLLRKHHDAKPEMIGLTRLRALVAIEQFFVGVLLVIPVMMIGGVVAQLMRELDAPREFLEQQQLPLIPIGDVERLLVFLVLAIVAPLAEEIVFRGFVQTLLVSRFGPLLGIVFTALLFTSLHVIGGYVFLMVLALALGIARHVSGNLYVCIGLHLAQNFVPALFLALGT